MKTRISAVGAALLLATVASAEESTFNLHLEPAAGFGFNRSIAMSGASLKVDTTLLGIPMLVPQLEVYGVGAANNTYLAAGSAFGGGIGLRLRLLNDEKGYRFSPGGINGNWWGNLWVDAHVTYNHGGLGVGMDAALGYEFSILDGLQIGPFAKFMLLGAKNPTLHFGLSFTVVAPSHEEFFSDADKDGLAGAQDKCPDKAGPESNQGCPLPDKDNDGVEDVADKCPDVAGPRENAGCPLDKDKDGIEDSKDKCPEQPGPAATGGCPDQDNDGVLDSVDKCPTKAGTAAMGGCPDTDGDGLSDADDKCPTEAGTAANGGCPDKDGDGVLDAVDQCPAVAGPAATNGCPDGDGDGVADAFDNCPTEKGEASNQGCPAAKKQLVVITKDALKILDKVQFASGKASILAKSFPLLDQVASVLKSQTQIKLVQVEGHTDNVGKAEANTKLSQQRADAVVEYLVKKGIEKARLKAVGFGQEKPVQTNDTAEGKEANRRVEFNIVSQ